MYNGAQLIEVATPPAAAGGSVPVWGASGGLVAASGGASATPAYPSGISAGMMLLLFGSAYLDAIAADPSGWTRVTDNASSPISSVASYLWKKTATGSESGTVSLAPAGTGTVWGAIHRFSASSLIDAVDIQNNTGPSLTTVVANCLAIAACLGYKSAAGNPTTISGESGGSWVQRYSLRDATTAIHDLETCDFPSTGSISGGAVNQDAGPVFGVILRG